MRPGPRRGTRTEALARAAIAAVQVSGGHPHIAASSVRSHANETWPGRGHGPALRLRGATGNIHLLRDQPGWGPGRAKLSAVLQPGEADRGEACALKLSMLGESPAAKGCRRGDVAGPCPGAPAPPCRRQLLRAPPSPRRRPWTPTSRTFRPLRVAASPRSGSVPAILPVGASKPTVTGLAVIAGHEWVASQRIVSPSNQVEHRLGRSHPAMIESCRIPGIDGTVARCHPGRGLTHEIYDRRKCPVTGLSTVVAGWFLLSPSHRACPHRGLADDQAPSQFRPPEQPGAIHSARHHVGGEPP
jgi:hypothetical protein